MDTTAIKSLRALEWLCLRDSATGVTEMAVALRIAKSNAHRILTTLAAAGFARQIGDGRYEASLKTWELGSALLTRFDIRELARPAMLALSQQSGETVHLSVIDGADVVYLDKIEGPQPAQAYSRIGGRAPAYAVATGKAMLAFREMPADAVPDFVDFTAKTVCSLPALQKELSDIRLRGYAINSGEWRPDVGGIGAPICDHRGKVVAAVGISGATRRFSPERIPALAGVVVASAGKISHAYGDRHSQKIMAGPAGAGRAVSDRRSVARI